MTKRFLISLVIALMVAIPFWYIAIDWVYDTVNTIHIKLDTVLVTPKDQ